MALKFTPKWDSAAISKAIDTQIDRINRALLMRLQLIGETFVTNARLNGNYNDITGNLRSSIGYVILRNGEQLFENFASAGKPTVTSAKSGKGVGVAKNVAQEIAVKYPIGFVLICVAGMEYAAAVESKGKDVITASSIEAKNDLIEAIKIIESKMRA